MTLLLQLIILLTILNRSVAVVEFSKSKLYGEIDFATQVVYVPLFCSEGCRIYVSVPKASASIAKNIVVHDYIHDQFSLYDISQQVESDGQKGYFDVDVGNTQVSIINTNLGYATAPLAVWIVRKDATNFGYSKVFEADNLSIAPSSLQVVSIMSAVPFTLRTKTQGSTELISTLSGFDAVNSPEDECAQVIAEMDFDTFLDVQTFVQSPLITLFFNDEKRPTTSLSAVTGHVNDLDLSGVSFVASPGFIGCKGTQTFHSSLYDDYTSVKYSSYDRSYDVSISSVLNNDATHPVTINDNTNDKEYKFISTGGRTTTNLTIPQTNSLDISWVVQDTLSTSSNSFLLRLTPSNDTMITPITTTATTTKPVQYSTTTSSVTSTTTTKPQESTLYSCPSPLILYRDGQCRGYYATDVEYTDDSAGQVIFYCNRINAHPVSIHTEEQLDYWRAQKSERYFILGLTCNSRSKRWEWADGTVLDYKPPTFDKELDGDCKTGCNWYLESDGAWYIYCTHVAQDTDFFCIAQLIQPILSTDCGNFNDGSDDSQCYEITPEAETWDEARTICHSFGAELASIHSQQQNSYIRRLAVSRGAINGVLLGGTVSGKGKGFGWVDGTEWDYANFHPGFPIDGLGDCLSMDTITTAGQWMNTDCSFKMPVVCSRPLYDTPELADCSAGPWNEGQIIYSPGFPSNASVPCEYFLTVPAGRRVHLEILLLEANTCCDFLMITDGYIGGTVLANLTGEVSGATYTTKESNIMRVIWQPDGGVNVRGLMMSFTAY